MLSSKLNCYNLIRGGLTESHFNFFCFNSKNEAMRTKRYFFELMFPKSNFIYKQHGFDDLFFDKIASELLSLNFCDNFFSKSIILDKLVPDLVSYNYFPYIDELDNNKNTFFNFFNTNLRDNYFILNQSSNIGQFNFAEGFFSSNYDSFGYLESNITKHPTYFQCAGFFDELGRQKIAIDFLFVLNADFYRNSKQSSFDFAVKYMFFYKYFVCQSNFFLPIRPKLYSSFSEEKHLLSFHLFFSFFKFGFKG